MQESERLQRLKERCGYSEDRDSAEEDDEKFSERIALLLNHPQIDRYCHVDAYYYDFSVIPRDIQEKLNIWRDAYLIYGITTEGEIISKWVDRWDLDSNDPIEDGKVIYNDKPKDYSLPPEISFQFNAALLSAPMPENMLRMFSSNPYTKKEEA